MAKGSMLMGTQRGKLGESVLYRAGGEQRQRAYIKDVTNPKTAAQMQNRTQLANVVAFYRVVSKLFKSAFENKPSNRSDYNQFVSLNMAAGTPVYITREMAKSGGAVVAPYMITKGSLPSIQTTGNGINSVTNLAVGADFVISAATTVAELTAALIANNTNCRAGQQLSYVSIIQATNPNTGYPQLQGTLYEITLDLADTTPVRDLMPAFALSVVDGRIGHGESAGDGGFAWIISEKDAQGKIKVTTQRLILTDNSLYQSYSSTAAAAAAVVSYNGQDGVFLDPQTKSSGVDSGNSGSPAVASVTVNGTTLQTNSANTYQIPANATIVVRGSNLPESELAFAGKTTENGSYASISVTAGALSDTSHSYTTSGAGTYYALRIQADGVSLWSVAKATSGSGDNDDDMS